MRRFFTAATLIFSFVGSVQAFDQLPEELFTKIIVLAPTAIGALSSTNKQINLLCRSWTKNDKYYFTYLVLFDSPHYTYFIFKHSTKITEFDVKVFAMFKEANDPCLKVVAALYPHLVQKNLKDH